NSSFKKLVAGHDERGISPQNVLQIDKESSFYIASFVVSHEHCGNVLVFISEAFKFYEVTYPEKTWETISAWAYTPKGREWCKCKGMFQLEQSDIWFVDRELLKLLNPKNKKFWEVLLPGRSEDSVPSQEHLENQN